METQICISLKGMAEHRPGASYNSTISSFYVACQTAVAAAAAAVAASAAGWLVRVNNKQNAVPAGAPAG